MVNANLPAALAQILIGAEISPVTIGESGVEVSRISAREATYYLKVARGHLRHELRAENERLLWLRSRISVPEVIQLVEDDRSTYLLLSELPGKMACDFSPTAFPKLLQAFAVALRNFHSIPIADCPFDERLDHKLTEAKANMDSGLVDESDFEPQDLGRSAADLFEEVLRTRPMTEDLVMTHGDFCLPNVMIDPASFAITGYLDLSRAGISDRYQDLAIASRSVERNGEPGITAELFRAYGVDKIDYDKIRFYQLLDSFF